MLILKRLAVWLGETSAEVLLLGLALIALFGHDQHAVGRSLLAYYSTGLVLFSFTTGYLFTTAIARGIWRGGAWWSYSAVAVVLYLIHSEIFFVLSGGSTRPEQFSVQVAGALSCSPALLPGRRRCGVGRWDGTPDEVLQDRKSLVGYLDAVRWGIVAAELEIARGASSMSVPGGPRGAL